MKFSRSPALGLAYRVAFFTATVTNALPAQQPEPGPSDVITRDVCVLGGGSTGTYGAIRLKDKGQSIVVVERQDHLGGHAETLYTPNGHFDYGVQGYFNDKVSNDFFDRLGVEKRTLVPSTLKTDNVNFNTGKTVPPPSGALETIAGALLYRASIQQFDFLAEGPFFLPNPVPEDLLRPFGEFIEKHNLEGTLQLALMFSHGTGNLLEAPFLYVLTNWGIPQIDNLLTSYIAPKNGASQLFANAAKELGDDVLYNTKPTNVKRTDSGVEITVQSADGTTKLIKAKKLLSTIPPFMNNLPGWDLDENETDLFSKFHYNSYYAAAINNTGIPDKTSVANIVPENQPGSLPRKPFQWHMDYMGVSGYLASKVVADADFTADDAKNLILSDIQRMGAEGTYDITDPQIVAFADHTPTSMAVDPDEVRGGFYTRLYALQGKKSTWWTGFTFCSDYSSLLWGYTATVVDQMLAA